MPPLLRALPYYDRDTPITAVGTGAAEQARAYQFVVWVSATPVEQFELGPGARRFPAILDTGLNDNFAIAPVHLRAWAGIHWKDLPVEGVDRFLGNAPVPTRRAYVWVHPNQSGWRDWVDPIIPAVRFELTGGITVYGNGEQVGPDERTKTLRAPRLPLVGLRALTGMGCRIRVDCARRMVDLDVPLPV